MEGSSRFEGTMKFNRQQLNSIRDNTSNSKYKESHTYSLRESHESMRSIQKQRIQRSLQKSQEGRKKLEEKLEAISNRDRNVHGLGGTSNSAINMGANTASSLSSTG